MMHHNHRQQHHYNHGNMTPEYGDSPPPLPQRQRMTPQSNCGIIGNNPPVSVPPVMPVYPLRPTLSKYSPYSPSRFHIDKRCQHRCSWKCSSITLILLCVALTAMVAYFGAMSSMVPSVDNSNCIVVEDAKAVAQDGERKDFTSSQAPTEESLPTSTAIHSNPVVRQSSLVQQESGQTNQEQQKQSQQQWPAVVEIKQFKVPHKVTIPPLKFWSFEFQNKEPAFIHMNFTLAWGTNFAVYSRRNVAPSITQYDFLEFIRGGKAEHRLRRSANDEFLRDFLNVNNLMHLYTPPAVSAVSFTSSTTQKLKDKKFVSSNEVHVIPPPPFIVNHNRLEKSPEKVEVAQLNTKTEKTVSIYHVNETTNKHHKKDLSFGDHHQDLSKSHKVSKRSPDIEDNIGTSYPTVNVTLLQYLDTGRWFVSVFNDENKPQNITLVIAEAEGVSTACPNDCSGHGSCYLGKCDCIDGYEGNDCSKSVCPVLCSNHGKYGGGLCHCEEGWKGTECDTPELDCQVPDCSGNGQCLAGVCVCSAGWRGSFCEEADCPDPECSGHGKCVNGKCFCKAGWQGVNCSTVDMQVFQCLPRCSDHGSYELETGSCVCDNYWTGDDCSQELCNLDCGPHGICNKGKCECNPGWTGDRCDLMPCDSRCSEHGQCKNGTCVCSQGWNGRHCTLPGCWSSCNHHGMCTLEDGEYHCECSDGWAGIDCGVRLEMECNDDIDNDEDGMSDCSDSECCSHPVCADHIMCLASNDPVEVLLRKQPPSVTASFYQRVKFLIEENSVQSYAHMDEYSESQVSVMRGQVITPAGLGIVGVRVSVNRDSRFGFTLSRDGGWFDVMVNGGGAVTLQFQRSPFHPTTRTIFVPWNQIVVLTPVVMQLNNDNNVYQETFSPVSGLPISMLGGAVPVASGTIPGPCADHDHETLHPIIISTWMPEKVGGIPGRSVVFTETQILQESIQIPGSGLHLMYRSSQSPGYLSTVLMRLTHDTIPNTLTHVHVRVEIEGSIYSKTYESDPNLTHTFAWNKYNVYKQKVYGVTHAKISVGYEYSSCPAIVWETQTALIKGFDVDISDVGGWSLDIHHHYNFHEGILQKGDGTTLHFKQYPHTVKVLMGTGLQRTLECSDCNGPAKDTRLLSPSALTSGPDGSLYVGDFNLVRRITPDGNVYTVLQLRTTKISYQYYLCISPADGRLYISDVEKYQVLRTLSNDIVDDPSINYESVVGSGVRCIPGDDTFCGDEGPAKDAKLAHPKGLAIAADKTMYIADGTNIRSVDANGIIHTIVGHHSHHNNWMPIPCQGAVPAQQALLQWPTDLALNPLDGSLHFIDDHLVLKLTDDLKVKVVAGVPIHCRTPPSEHHSHQKLPIVTGGTNNNEQKRPDKDGSKATNSVLGAVVALAFSPTGDLYIAETDSHKVSSVYVINSAGKISNFAGQWQENIYNSHTCDCNNGSSTATSASDSLGLCQCSLMQSDSSFEHNSKETVLSSNIQFKSVSALAVTADGIINVVDQGNLHILSLEHYLPNHDENGEFKIPYPSTSEVYIFNRYGQHIATKDLTSGKTRYSFLYSKNTSFGKLSTVTDSSGNKILFLRDYSNVVSTIENTQDHKCDIKVSGIGSLVKFSEKGKMDVEFEYDSNSGLLTSRADLHRSGGSETYIYNFEANGRITDIVLPTGETVNILSKMAPDDGLAVLVTAPAQSLALLEQQKEQQTVTLRMEANYRRKLVIREGLATSEALSFRNGSYSVNSPWSVQFQGYSLSQHPLLQLSLPVEAEMLPMSNKQTLTMGDGLTNTMHWTYNLVGDVRTSEQIIYRELWINHSSILGIKYDQSSNMETFYDRDRTPLLSISYTPAGLPLIWTPNEGSFPVNISYDMFNRVVSWKWGVHSENYSYGSHGSLAEISNLQNDITHFTYDDQNLLTQITLPSQRKFVFQYDDDGGLRHVSLPSGTRHSFSCQPSIGFLRVTYTPPGSTKPYIQHYDHSGALLQTVFPNDGGRVLYRYHSSGQLTEVVHGDGRSQINYSPVTRFPSEILHNERDFEYRWDYQYVRGLLTEERLSFEARTGLSNAKFTYDYDTNFRLVAIQGRIGGQTLPDYNLRYNVKTGFPEQLGQFMITRTKGEIRLFDGTASFTRIINPYFQETKVSVTIHQMEVFRMDFTYDSQSRINQTRTNTRNVGVNSYSNTKNYTWDSDGQLIGIEAQEPWGFKYDDNGNMLSLTYRGNTIPMEYNALDHIVKFGEGLYHYDNRGLIVQNAREERFHYNAKGLLVRATKRGRFDVRYYYDHLDRLTTRKDHYGNVTQFFYTNHKRAYEVSQIYSPRDGKLVSLVYDDRGHLIYAQVYRHKYYVATDQCGTPIMVFNQYGEGVREIMRSPYGHIIYDSNPYLYLPIDFCGGLLDQVTSLVHMPNGKVYDPLIGQWMTPMWEGVLDRVSNPSKLHLYRFNGNDPINVKHKVQHLTDYQSWLSVLGYDLESLAPQLYPEKFPMGGMSPSLKMGDLIGSHSSNPFKRTLSLSMPDVMYSKPSIQLEQSLMEDSFGIVSGFYTHLSERRLGDASTLSAPPRSLVKKDIWPPEDFPTKNPASVFTFHKLGAESDPPFGKGILVSRTSEGRAIVRSVPTANSIYRDVFTSVFNQTYILPFTLLHNGQQDIFYFIKEDTWSADEDRGQLKRLGGQINITFHERTAESTDSGRGSGKVFDFKIHGVSSIINLRYGTTPEKEKQRLLHHAKTSAARKAWHHEKDVITKGFSGTIEWSTSEMDEILKSGRVSNYETEYVHDIQHYPELAEDPFNIKFMRKTTNVAISSFKDRKQ